MKTYTEAQLTTPTADSEDSKSYGLDHIALTRLARWRERELLEAERRVRELEGALRKMPCECKHQWACIDCGFQELPVGLKFCPKCYRVNGHLVADSATICKRCAALSQPAPQSSRSDASESGPETASLTGGHGRNELAWIKEKAAQEDGCDVSAGGMAHDLGFDCSRPTPDAVSEQPAPEPKVPEGIADAQRYRYLKEYGFRFADVSLTADYDQRPFVRFRPTFDIPEPVSFPHSYDEEEWTPKMIDAAIDAALNAAGGSGK